MSAPCQCGCVYTHFVQDVRGGVENAPVKALCGKVWRPGKDAALHRRCPECLEIRESLGEWLA